MRRGPDSLFFADKGVSYLKGKGIFLFLSLLATLSMAGIAAAVAYRSIIFVILAVLVLCAVMGYGFATKKKYRDLGKL